MRKRTPITAQTKERIVLLRHKGKVFVAAFLKVSIRLVLHLLTVLAAQT